MEACQAFKDFLAPGSDPEVDAAHTVLVVWPGLKVPGSYMCTRGGVSPRGFQGEWEGSEDEGGG